MVRTPYSIWSAEPGLSSSHLSYSWENLPEPGTSLEETETKFSLDLLQLAGTISSQDYNKILKGNFNVSKTTTAIIAKIKTLHEQENAM
jgi:hypothetical protein